MNRTPINADRVSLHPKSLSDAPRDYIWRKDVELSALNGQPPLRISFIRYLTLFESTPIGDHPAKEMLSIKTACDGRHIGNCAIYDIDWDLAEAHVGIAIGDRRYWGQGYGNDSFRALVDYAFNHLGMRRLHLKTLERNTRAQKCFSRCGFKTCGSLLENANTYIMMQLTYEDYVNREMLSCKNMGMSSHALSL
jgi:RimJ/RimL family protein N-acetyltransferase